MSLTFAEGANPEAMARVARNYAKALKPCCLNCRKTLAGKDLRQGRVCVDREKCRLRSILLGGSVSFADSYQRIYQRKAA